MEINLINYFCLLDESGFSLSPDECVLLQDSLNVLKYENEFAYMYFWGKIFGLASDYYIAYGCQNEILNTRKYFYSKDAIKWYYMPTPYIKHIVLTELAVFPIHGDPCLVVDVNKKWKTVISGLEEEDDDDKLNKMLFEDILIYDIGKESSKKLNKMEDILLSEHELKEEDRLSTIIKNITFEGLIVPRGSIKRFASGIVGKNSGFLGLKETEALDPLSYMHLRYPTKMLTGNFIKRDEIDLDIDFLDSIDSTDIPQGCWNISQKNDIIYLKNLKWPGLIFFHRIGKPEFGNLYFGYGKRNWDTPFMML